MNKKYYININTELNIYRIIEYCYNRLAIPIKACWKIYKRLAKKEFLPTHIFI